MMRFLDKYYRAAHVAGLNIEINREGNPSFSLCLLAINGNELEIETTISNFEDVALLMGKISPETPLALNIAGRGVLLKEAAYNDQMLVNFSTLFPNSSPEDFYIQEFTSGNKSFTSVIRKKEADKWINLVKELGFISLVLSLGPFVAEQVLRHLNVYDTEFNFNSHQVRLNEQREWLSANSKVGAKSAYPYKIGNERINEELIIPYAAAFQLALYPKISLIASEHKYLGRQLNLFYELRKTKVQGAIILCCALIALLMNFALFSFYTSANARLAIQAGQSEVDAGKTQSLADSIKFKKALLDTLGWEGVTNKSILIDQLAQVLPAEIKWQQVAADPFQPSIVTDAHKLNFTSRFIKINGTAARIIPVNEWIARIRTKPWVKNAELVSYAFNNEQNTGQFLITVSY